MPLRLRVKSPFGRFVAGSEISDPAEIAVVLASHNEPMVVKYNAPDEPAKSAPVVAPKSTERLG